MKIQKMDASMKGYLSPKLEGYKKEWGHGVRAVAAVRPGEILIVWGGTILTGSELGKLTAQERKISVQVDDDMYLVTPAKWIGPSDWVNHSCNPNAGLRGQITLVAMRAIKVGEDVCFDYAMSDGNSYDEFDCLCGARACRGRVQGNDWQRPELWKKYAGFFSPHLQARIARLAKTSERRQERTVQIGVPALAVR